MYRVAALLLLMAGAGWGGQGEEPGDRRREALERAAAWLIANAKEPDLWDYGPGSYAPWLCSRARGSPCVLRGERWSRAIDDLCLTALLEAWPWLDPAARKRMDALFRRRGQGFSSDPWEIAMGIDLTLLAGAMGRMSRQEARETFRAADAAIGAIQSREGAIGYGGPGSGDSTPLMTGVLVHLLERGVKAGLHDRTAVLERARAFLRSAWSPARDGFPYLAVPTERTANGEAEMAGRSVLGALALEAGTNPSWRDRLARMTRRYVDCIPAFERSAWGRELHDPDTGIASYYVYFGAYYAAEASIRLGKAGEAQLQAVVAWILRLQKEDGSFWDGTCHAPLHQTAYAARILALSLASDRWRALPVAS